MFDGEAERLACYVAELAHATVQFKLRPHTFKALAITCPSTELSEILILHLRSVMSMQVHIEPRLEAFLCNFVWDGVRSELCEAIRVKDSKKGNSTSYHQYKFKLTV